MRVLRADEYRRMPWRNGGGETAEVAIGPPGATIDDFDWRVSMARIEVGGPFSSFSGKDRTLMILQGDGLQLSITDCAPVDLTCHSEPFAFSGDAPAHATLLGGTVTDLNVMTDRARCSHTVRRLLVAGSVDIAVEAPQALLVCADGKLQIDLPHEEDLPPAELKTRDALLVEGGATTLRVFTEGSVLIYLIEIQEGIATR